MQKYTNSTNQCKYTTKYKLKQYKIAKYQKYKPNTKIHITKIRRKKRHKNTTVQKYYKIRNTKYNNKTKSYNIINTIIKQ